MRLATIGIGILVLVSVTMLSAQQPNAPKASRYLVTWVGDADGADDDFLAVLDVAPGSKTYAHIINTTLSGIRGTAPHHTEHFFSPGHPLFANGFAGNKSVRFDLSDPTRPKLLGPVNDVPGLAFPHSFLRLPNGNILATMQAKDGDFTPPGGLAEFGDDGKPVRWGSAANDVDPGTRPYSMVVLPESDRIIVSCGRMFTPGRTVASPLDHPGFVIQLWRLSDLSLLKTIALTVPANARPNIQRNPYELRKTNGGDVLLSTGSGALYRITGLDAGTFRADFVYDFGGGAYVPVIVGRYWIQAVSTLRRVVALDVSNPAKPWEISRVEFDERQSPHWLGLDDLSNRIVVANASDQNEARLWMLQMDPVSGKLAFDDTFRDPADNRPGVSFERSDWPHGRTGRGVPHGSVFIH